MFLIGRRQISEENGYYADFFKSVRDSMEKKCPKCGHDAFYWHKCRQQYQCKACAFRFSVTRGTVMDHTRLPIRTWFKAMQFMVFSDKIVTFSDIMTNLDFPEYVTVRGMVMKIRTVMGMSDTHLMEEIQEVGSGLKKICTDIGSSIYRSGGKAPYVYAYVGTRCLTDEELSLIEQQDNASKDEALELNDLKFIKFIVSYENEDSGFVNGNERPDWVTEAVESCKDSFGTRFRDIDPDKLQLYLDEFTYKYNRESLQDCIMDMLVHDSCLYPLNLKSDDLGRASSK